MAAAGSPSGSRARSRPSGRRRRSTPPSPQPVRRSWRGWAPGGPVAVPIEDAAAAVRTLAERIRVLAEGAGALAPAAALAGRAGTGKIVCVVSGGNINLDKLAGILGGGDG